MKHEKPKYFTCKEWLNNGVSLPVFVVTEGGNFFIDWEGSKTLTTYNRRDFSSGALYEISEAEVALLI
jgi:hypothetical protein